ncbi:MAG: Spy/CpxP family protein refolding chaperone [Syntrophales bacterium]
MKKTLIAATVLIFLAAVVSQSLAFNGPMGRRGPGPGYCANPAAIPGLGLTEEQTAKINALRESYLRETKPLQDKMFSRRGDLKLLWLERNPDQAKIAAVQKEIRSLRDQLQDKRTNYHFEILKVLTPEQQERFRSACMGRGMGPGYGHGRGGGYGPGRGMMSY